MSLRELTPEEKLILGLIIEQRERSGRDDDLFIYDVRLGQRKLSFNGAAVKYGIDLSQHHEIIRRLTEDTTLPKDCLINADWIVAFDSGGINYKFAYHDETWLDGVEENYEISPIFFNNKKDLENFYYVQLNFRQIKTINENYIIQYSCALSYDDEKCRFFVTRDDNEEKYIISNNRLKNGCPPFKVLLAAFQSDDNYIERDDLIERHNLKQITGKSISTQVFDDNSVVRNELATFVDLKSDSIRIYPKAKLSLARLEALKKVCV